MNEARTWGGAHIDGVNIVTLKTLSSTRGHLMEVQRVDEPDFHGFGQVYVTRTLPGIIKAWYRHKIQVDQIAIITGAIKLVLYDSRGESPTCGNIMEIVLEDTRPCRAIIPPGVWHGFQAALEREAFLLHLNSEPWHDTKPDEERLAPDTDKIPYRW